MESTPLRVVRSPRVTLLARQEFVYPEHIHWESDSEVPGQVVTEFAGRLCYLSFGADAGLEGGHKTIGGRTTNEEYLANILKVKHGSVLEHAVWTLLLEGVSRALTHELVRHRAGFGFCLTGDTLVYSEHHQHGRRNGTKKRTLRKLYEMSQTSHGRSRLKLLRLRCLDEASGAFSTGRVAKVVCSGIKPVFRVELEDGKTITCSQDHRFLTSDGWKPLHEIAGGIEVTENGVTTWGAKDAEISVNGTAAYRDADWLRRQYHDNGFDQATIAAIAGVSPHTIRSWVRKHGLQKPLGSWSRGVQPWNRGKHYRAGWTHSEETRRILSCQKSGAGNPQWKGGITRDAIRVRRGVEALRTQVYERDGFCCRVCGRKGRKLTLHHILPVWARPDLVEDLDNIASVCRRCHLDLNGHELESLHLFGRAPIQSKAHPRHGRGNLLVPRMRRIVNISFAGEQETYDLEMEGPNHNFVANGIVTHNSQLSQRYVDESQIAFVLPPEIEEETRAYDLWSDACAGSLESYRTLLEELTEQIGESGSRTMRKKRARQAARSVLPNAAETKIVVTGNARAWRHFVEMRGSASADVEIRRLAVAVLRLLQTEAPHIFGDLRIVAQEDGTEGVEAENSKV